MFFLRQKRYIRLMAVPILTYDLAFEITSATAGVISITDTTNWAGAGIDPADVEVFIEITDPTGLVWHPINMSLPDILPDVSTNFQQVLQRDVTGAPMAGDYIIRYLADVSGAVSPGVYEIGPDTFTLCADRPEICLKESIDCLYMYGRIEDRTSWGSNGWTLGSRSMTLTWPANISGGGPSPVTTSGTYIDIPVGQLYTGSYSVLMTIEATNGSTVLNLQKRYSFSANCVQSGQDLCSMLCCLESVYMKAQTNNGGAQGTTVGHYQMMAALMVQAQAQASCGHGDLLADTLKRFYALGQCTNCGCGCESGDCGDSGPTLLVPIHPGAGSGQSFTFTIAAGPGITVDYNSGTETWTIGLANIGLISSLYNTVVTAGTGIQVNVTGPVGSPPTYTYEVVNTMPATESVRWKLRWDVRANTFAQTTPVVVGSTFTGVGITVTPFAPGPSGTFFRVQNFIASGSPQFMAKVTVASRELTPYAAGYYPYAKIVEAVMADFSYTGNPNSFAFGLCLTTPLPGGVVGWNYPMSYYDTYLAFLELEFEVYKL